MLSKQHFTQPPPRYNEALLIKELEEKGIGRPSTYASIISTIQDRKYAEKVEGRFAPTETGRTVNNFLMKGFPGPDQCRLHLAHGRGVGRGRRRQ